MSLKRLNLSARSYTVREFYLRSGGEEYTDKWDLTAPYQRQQVWTPEQKRNLIRSLLRGLPTGIVLANLVEDLEHPTRFARIVDGKQRIMAIRDFVEGRFAVPATWFPGEDVHAILADPSTDEAAAVRYSGLSRQGRLGFDGSILATYVSRLSTLEEEAELYLLINFGGEPQTEEDRKRAAVIATREG